MKINRIKRNQLYKALPLVWKVFSKYEAVNYPETGKQAFYDAIHSEEYLNTLDAYGAYESDELIGMIATSREGSHITLFYVDGKYHNQGIGRSLWNAVLAKNTSEVITVHSSLYAVEVYKKLGFRQTGDAKCEDGIQYVPMEYRMVINENCRCRRLQCTRHGKCNECRAHHAGFKHPRPVACESIKNVP